MFFFVGGGVKFLHKGVIFSKQNEGDKFMETLLFRAVDFSETILAIKITSPTET